MTSTYVNRTDNQPGRALKAPVLVATSTNISLTGEQTISATAVTDGDRVLVAAQTDATENGIYVCRANAWERATDWSRDTHVVNGCLVAVTVSGTWHQTAFSGEFNIGVTEVSFVDAFVGGGVAGAAYDPVSNTWTSDSSGWGFSYTPFTARTLNVVDGNTLLDPAADNGEEWYVRDRVLRFIDQGEVKYGAILSGAAYTPGTGTTVPLNMYDGAVFVGPTVELQPLVQMDVFTLLTTNWSAGGAYGYTRPVPEMWVQAGLAVDENMTVWGDTELWGDVVAQGDITMAGNLNALSATATFFELTVQGSGTNNPAAPTRVNLPNLPTSDPLVAGRLWNDAGTLKISAG